MHEYEAGPSTHVAPLTHACDLQSSMFWEQFLPVKPGAHWQLVDRGGDSGTGVGDLGSKWVRLGQIRDFFRWDFSTESKSTEISSAKVLDLSHFGVKSDIPESYNLPTAAGCCVATATSVVPPG